MTKQNSNDSGKTAQDKKREKGKGKTGESKDSEKTDQAQKGDKVKGKAGGGKELWKTVETFVRDRKKFEIHQVIVGEKPITPTSWKPWPTGQRSAGVYQSLTETVEDGNKQRLNKPRLVVSVIGDEVEDIPDKLRQEFQEGITTLLKTQDLWLLTRKPCQTHCKDTGFIKLVGKAFERLTPNERDSAVVIGVGTNTCTCIKDKNDEHQTEAVQSTTDGQPSQNETSAESNAEKGRNNKPDSKSSMYTCSIILDCASNHAVAEFIAEFQSYISPSKKDSELIATSVALVFGGRCSMNTFPVFEKGMPVVIVKDSGGAADYIATHVLSGEFSEKDIAVKIRSVADVAAFLEAISKAKRWKELVNVCVLDGEPTDKETKGLKAAVLKAAIQWHEERVEKNDQGPKPRRFSHQMIDLSLLLDESQLAKTHIFDKEYQREKSQEEKKENTDKLKEVFDTKKRLKEALVNNQPNFVKLFLEAKYKYCNIQKLDESDVIDLYDDMLGPQAKTDDAVVSLIKGLIKGDWSDGYKQGNTLRESAANSNHETTTKSNQNTTANSNQKTTANSNEKTKANSTKDNTVTANSNENTPATSKQNTELIEQLHKIENVISKLVGPYYKLTGIYDKPDDEGCRSGCCKGCARKKEGEEEDLKIDIGTHLFLWAVLFNRIDIAFFFWQHGNIEESTLKHPHIIMALMASTILANLAKKAEDGKEPALQEQLAKHAKLFEVRASDVLMECSISDRHATQDLLIREHTRTIWGEGSSLLSAAFTGKRKHFLERMPCQVKLAAVWRGQIVWSTATWKIFLTTILPFLIGILKFNENESPTTVLSRMLNLDKDKKKPKNQKGSKSKKAYRVGPKSWPEDDDNNNKTNKTNDTNVTNVKDTKSTVSFITAWLYLYSAPIAKYYCFTISYMVFLGIFSLTCLTNLHPGYPSLFEWIVWAWIIIFMAEEIIEIQSALAFGNNGLRIWFHNNWNRFDGALYFIVSPLCFLLRIFLVGDEFQHARHAFAITLACYFFRFLQCYYAFREVGSKVLIIFHMMKDLFKFALVLGVFVLSYGMAITIILYPNRKISWAMLRYVLYSPFWQIFVRDAFVDRVDGEDGSTICTGNKFNTTLESDSPCRVNSQFGDALLIVYTMFTNVLLLNILIAMFNSTYERIQRESNTWWHYNRYSLVYEYLEKPRLAPPLIIFSYLHRILRWLFSCAKGCRCQCTTDGGIMCNENDEELDNFLTHFERINMEILMERQEKQNEVRKKLDELGLAPKQSEREWEADMLDNDDDSSDDDEMQTGIALAMHQMVKTLPDTISKKLGVGRRPLPTRTDRMDVMEKKLDKLTKFMEKIEKRL